MGKLSTLRRDVRNAVHDRYLAWKNARRTRHLQPPDSAGAVRAMEDRFIALIRILGNDLRPRHGARQTWENIQFIVAREPLDRRYEKSFVLNRIFDQNRERKIRDYLDGHGYAYDVIPFDAAEYGRLGWDEDYFGSLGFFESPAFRAMSDDEKDTARILACAPRIRYAMNVNAARNVAIRRGLSRAAWVLPWDGACVMGAESLDRLARSCSAAAEVPYVIVPMHRLARTGEFDGPVGPLLRDEEPQLGFSRHARNVFDESWPYGVRDKASLLKEIGVPGPWNYWRRARWIPEKQRPNPDRHHFVFTDAVALRLPAGMRALDAAGRRKRRYLARNEAILTTIAELDRRYGRTDTPAWRLVMGR